MLLALAGVSSVAMAQQKTEVVEEFGVIQVQDKYQVITNPFWSNWFFSIGGGAEATFGDNDKAGSFGKRISPTLNFAIGKWFTPGLGVRLQYSGLQARGYTYDAGADYVKGTQMDDGYYKQRFDYMNLHGDVMFNLNALFGGYNQHRVYEIIPYVGAGFTHNYTKPHREALSVNAGIINRFRISNAIDINLELSAMGVEDKFDGEVGGDHGYDGVLSATVGLTYRFPARGFRRPMPQLISQVELAAMQAQLAEMENVMRFWIGMGCDGFRVDMAGSLVKNDEDGKGNIALWRKVRAFLDAEFPEAVLVSEWGEPDKSLQGGFHMDFLLHFGPSHYNDLFRCEEPFFSGRGKGDVAAFVEKYKENYEKAQRKGLICIPSGNHDMDRLARSIHGEELKVAFAFLLSMPGAPFLYYGDEIGMRYVENLHSVEGGYGRTGSRSPMQWDHTTNAGFSAAPKEKLYVKQDEATDRPTVEAQMADPDSLYHEIQKLINLRQAHSALQSRGEIEFVYAEEKQYPLAYLRSDDREKILVIINPADREASFEGDYAVKEALYTFGGEAAFAGGKVTVPRGSAGFYLL